MLQQMRASLSTTLQPVRDAWNNVRARLDAIKILGRPLTWYISDWRFGVIMLVVAIIFPQVIGNEALITVGVGVGIYVLLALGLNIVVGYAGLLDLGYVAFFVLGSFVAAIGSAGFIYNSKGGVVNIPTFPFWVLIIGGAVVAGFFGVLLGIPTLRLRGDYLAIVTLGFGQIVPIVFAALPFFGGNVGLGAAPPADINTPIGSISFSNPLDQSGFYYLTLLCVVLVVILVVALRDSSLGRAWVAIREDETAAAASGINLVRTKLLAFGLGAMIGGVGGVLNATTLGVVLPASFNFQISISILTMIVLGGLSSIPGAIVGAIILKFADLYFIGAVNDYVQTPSNNVPAIFTHLDLNETKFLVYGLFLVAIILLRPQGIIPNQRRKRELHGEGVAIESISAVGAVAIEESGGSLGGIDATDETEYTGAGSDARGREE